MRTLYRYWTILVAIAGTGLSLLVLFAVVPPGEAEGTSSNAVSWRPVGPAGGDVTELIHSPADPDTVFAITRGTGGTSTDTLYKSTDRGNTWTIIDHSNVTSGTAFIALEGLAVSPANSMTMYLAGHNGLPTIFNSTKLFKSIDGGATWSPSSNGVDAGLTFVPQHITIDPRNPQVVYLSGTSGTDSLFRSTDGGATWSAYSPRPDLGNPAGIMFDPANPAIAYIRLIATSIGHSGHPYLLRSSDGGQTWQPIAANGLPLASDIRSLGMNGTSPQTAYAGFAGEQPGLYRTTNGGTSWAPAMTGLPAGIAGGIVKIAVDPVSANTAYAAAANTFSNTNSGVFKTTDGSSWSAANTGLPDTLVNDLQVNPMTPTIVYAGLENNGVYRSTDGGATWAATAGIPANCSANAIDISKAQPNRVLAGIKCSSTTTVYSSQDGGATWQANLISFGGGLGLAGIATHPVSPTVAYVAAEFGSIYRTVDGQSWALLSSVTRTFSTSPLFTGTANLSGLVIDPANPNILYATSSDTGAGVFKSIDGGQSWSELKQGLDLGLVRDLAVDPSTSGRILAAVGQPSQNDSSIPVYLTTNGGATWQPASNGLPAGGGGTFTRLALDPGTSGTLYAGFTSGFNSTSSGTPLYKSTDSGTTWIAIGTGLPFTETLQLHTDPSNPANLIAIANEKIYLSTDGGLNFSVLTPSGVPADALAQDVLALNGSSPAQQANGTVAYLLATATELTSSANPIRTPIYRSGTLSGVWTPSSAGINAVGTYDIIGDPGNAQVLYAAARFGVIKSTNAGGSWTYLPISVQVTSTLGFVRSFHPEKLLISPDGTTLHAIGGNTFVRTTDGGTTWLTSTLDENAVSPAKNTFVIAPSDGATLYVAGGQSGNYAYRSTNGGVSWQQRLSITTASSFQVFAVDPRDAKTLLAGTLGVPAATNILWKSTDGAGSWTPIGAGLPPTSPVSFGSGAVGNGVYGLAIFPAEPDTVLAVVRGTVNNKVTRTLYRSTDAGANFSPITSISSTVLSDDTRFAFDPVEPDTVYLSAFSRFNTGSRVYVSYDSGQTWTELTNGLNGLPVQGLTVARIGANSVSTVFAATGGGSVYKFGNERNLIPLAGRNGALEP